METEQRTGRTIGARKWSVLLLFGLVGQLAWSIENMYFNVFVYNTITTDPSVISAMVAASAVTATVMTLLVGAWSDRVGRRKAFMTVGYILWGLSTMAFGFISLQGITALLPAANAVHAASVLVVLLDCVMTVFGSSANDGAFNAWVTDNISDDNRGRAEAVLATLPLVAMLIIFGGFDSLTQQGRWQLFFTIFGVLVMLAGITGYFLVKDAPDLRRGEGGYFKNIFYGMRPSVVRGNRTLYTVLLAMLVFSSSAQVFLPYLIIYIQNYLRMDNYPIVLGVVLIVASVSSALLGRVIDRVGKLRFLAFAAPVEAVGLVLMVFARGTVGVILAGIVMMTGYMAVSAAISGLLRDYTPAGKAGHFQGIRMIFMVALPMIIGPAIGSAVIKGSGLTYVELGVTKQVPTPHIFTASAVLLALLIPVLLLLRRAERRHL